MFLFPAIVSAQYDVNARQGVCATGRAGRCSLFMLAKFVLLKNKWRVFFIHTFNLRCPEKCRGAGECFCGALLFDVGQLEDSKCSCTIPLCKGIMILTLFFFKRSVLQ